MKIYTGRGDDGTAGLLSGERVPKSHERIDAFGDIDELSSALGVLRAGLTGGALETDAVLRRIQSDLLKIGACLAAWRDAPVLERLEKIDDDDVRFIETSIDALEAVLPRLKGFLLSTGHPSAAWAHFARSVCRRAERKVVGLSVELKVGRPPRQLRGIMVYLNRLSDYLFVLGRYCNHLAQVPDDIWKT
jgi:cob(I)alamin adenosyltransferase